VKAANMAQSQPKKQLPRPTVESAPPAKVEPPMPQSESELSTEPSLYSGSTSVPNIRTGDRWILQTQDLNNPQWSNTTERIVTDVGTDGITVTSRNTKSNYTRVLTFTPQWSLIAEREPSGKGAHYSPPMRYFDFPLEQGRTWQEQVRKSKTDGGVERIYDIAGEVLDWEKVDVPAGTFDAVKVLLHIEVRENGELISQSTDTSWYAPRAKRSVKTEEVSLDVRSGQESRRSIALIEYSISK